MKHSGLPIAHAKQCRYLCNRKLPETIFVRFFMKLLWE